MSIEELESYKNKLEALLGDLKQLHAPPQRQQKAKNFASLFKQLLGKIDQDF